MYQIKIIRIEKRSPEELAEIREARKWGRDVQYQPNLSYLGEDYKEVKQLETALTEDEFQAIKKAALGVM